MIVPGRRVPPPRAHRFEIGQRVRLRPRQGLSLNLNTTYKIEARMPERDDCLQYRVRSTDEPHDRVVSEDSLMAVIAQ